MPIGGGNVAQTYIVTNPGNGSTGIALNSGQNVSIHTEARVFDSVFGVETRRPLNFSNPATTGTVPSLTTGFGLRYGYSTLKHDISQSSPTFAGINSDANLEVNFLISSRPISTGMDIAAAGRSGFFGGGTVLPSHRGNHHRRQCNTEQPLQSVRRGRAEYKCSSARAITARRLQ